VIEEIGYGSEQEHGGDGGVWRRWLTPGRRKKYYSNRFSHLAVAVGCNFYTTSGVNSDGATRNSFAFLLLLAKSAHVLQRV
jgi:predicted transcriptional regulator